MKPISEAWFCQIELTNICHLNCLYCSRYNRHLTIEEIEDNKKAWYPGNYREDLAKDGSHEEKGSSQ